MFIRKSFSVLFIIFLFFFTSQLVYGYKGVTIDSENSVIHIIDMDTNTITGPFLSGVYSPISLSDIIITKDGNIAIISAFSDYIVAFVDITDTNNPQILAEVDFSNTPFASDPFHPEDLAITTDEKFLLVSDGAGFNQIAAGIASINVQTQSLVEYKYLPDPMQVQNVSVDQYGNVYAGDFDHQQLYILNIDSSTGELSYTDTNFALSFYPLNSYISPPGDSLLVVGEGGVEVFSINGAGDITSIQGIADIDGDGFDEYIQSGLYSADGSKLYLADFSTGPDRIIIMDVNPNGTISFSGTAIDLLTDFSVGFHGMDIIGFEPIGNKLYIGNMADKDPNGIDIFTNDLMVLDLLTETVSTVSLSGTNPYPVATAFQRINIFPKININPLSINFGNVTVGNSKSIVITVTNIGEGLALDIGALSITGTNASMFSILNDNCSNQSLSPGESQTATIKFLPNKKCPKNATLSIPSNDPNTPIKNIPLKGKGQPKRTTGSQGSWGYYPALSMSTYNTYSFYGQYNSFRANLNINYGPRTYPTYSFGTGYPTVSSASYGISTLNAPYTTTYSYTGNPLYYYGNTYNATHYSWPQTSYSTNPLYYSTWPQTSTFYNPYGSYGSYGYGYLSQLYGSPYTVPGQTTCK